jgi:imidazolonepropionase-like amidohydrolase
MPGLVDAHAHLTWASSIEKIYHQFILPPDQLKEAAWRNARVLLDQGFTSAYSAGALVDGIEPELAAAIAAGETPGPRYVPPPRAQPGRRRRRRHRQRVQRSRPRGDARSSAIARIRA